MAPRTLRSASNPGARWNHSPEPPSPRKLSPPCFVGLSTQPAEPGSKCRVNGGPTMELAFWVGRVA